MKILNQPEGRRRPVGFRGVIPALALIALLPVLASAQVVIGGVGGSQGGPLMCTANVANPTQARAEGHSELLGDIAILCMSGVMPAPGSAVPTVDITISLGALVTSKTFGGGVSEAL